MDPVEFDRAILEILLPCSKKKEEERNREKKGVDFAKYLLKGDYRAESLL